MKHNTRTITGIALFAASVITAALLVLLGPVAAAQPPVPPVPPAPPAAGPQGPPPPPDAGPQGTPPQKGDAQDRPPCPHAEKDGMGPDRAGRGGYGRPFDGPPPNGPRGTRSGEDFRGQGGPGPRFGRGFEGQDGPPPSGRGFGGPGGPGRPPMNPERIFKDMDANGDNMLSKEEFMDFHARMRPPMGPGQNGPERRSGGPDFEDRQGPPPPPEYGAYDRPRGPRPGANAWGQKGAGRRWGGPGFEDRQGPPSPPEYGGYDRPGPPPRGPREFQGRPPADGGW